MKIAAGVILVILGLWSTAEAGFYFTCGYHGETVAEHFSSHNKQVLANADRVGTKPSARRAHRQFEKDLTRLGQASRWLFWLSVAAGVVGLFTVIVGTALVAGQTVRRWMWGVLAVLALSTLATGVAPETTAVFPVAPVLAAFRLGLLSLAAALLFYEKRHV